MADKSRVSYPPALRSDAKAKQHGLLTVSLTLPNGERLEEQGVVGIPDCMFAKWAMAILFCPEVRALPDLEATIRQLMEKKA